MKIGRFCHRIPKIQKISRKNLFHIANPNSPCVIRSLEIMADVEHLYNQNIS